MKRLVALSALLALIPALPMAAGVAPMPTICNQACWNARARTCNPNLDNNFLERAIIHHTAAASDYDINTLEEGKAKMRAKQNYYVDVRLYCDLGYNFMVDRLGHIYEGRVRSISDPVRGAHAQYFNNTSFGFSFFGYFHPPYNHPAPAAMRHAMYDIVAWRMPDPFTGFGAAWYNAPTVGNTYYGYIDGHRTVATQTTNTSCPGDGIWHYMGTDYNGGEMRTEINARILGIAPPWRATYVADTLPASIQAGSQQTVAVTYTNTGEETWTSGGGGTNLATSDPRDRNSPFYTAGDWPGAHRPSGVDTATAPGADGTFTFVATAPATPGHHIEHYELVQEMVSWFGDDGDNVTWRVTVSAGGLIHIEAEDYDNGGPGVGYHDNESINRGEAYRDDFVDIEVCWEGGYNVAWIGAGEWLRYSNIRGNGGTYNIAVRVASPGTTGAFHVEVNGQNVSGTVGVPATGGWQTWATIAAGTATLADGPNTIRMMFTGEGFNLNWLRFEPQSAPVPTPTQEPPARVAGWQFF